jgi:hypothetical protein
MLGGPDAEGRPLLSEHVGEDVDGAMSKGTVVYFNETIQRDLEIEELYAQPWQIALRRVNNSWCVDPECTLSGGLAHVGECEPCKCGLEHAIDECPETYKEGGVDAPSV